MKYALALLCVLVPAVVQAECFEADGKGGLMPCTRETLNKTAHPAKPSNPIGVLEFEGESVTVWQVGPQIAPGWYERFCVTNFYDQSGANCKWLDGSLYSLRFRSVR
jgi:hypothetical protein